MDRKTCDNCNDGDNGLMEMWGMVLCPFCAIDAAEAEVMNQNAQPTQDERLYDWEREHPGVANHLAVRDAAATYRGDHNARGSRPYRLSGDFRHGTDAVVLRYVREYEAGDVPEGGHILIQQAKEMEAWYGASQQA